MATILKVVGMDNKGSFGLVHVVMQDGTEAVVYVGGDCEVFFHRNTVKAYVKKNKPT